MTPAPNSIRLALYYAAYFAVIGILLPFWPVWLSAKGLTATQIGLVLASAPFVRAFASPLIAQYSDQKGLRQPIIMGLTAVAAAAFAAFYFISGFWAIILVTVLFFMFFSASQPLAESLTMHVVRTESANYGRIRLWGSITFIVAAVGGGAILEGRDANVIFYLSLAGLGILFLVCVMLPRVRFEASPSERSPLLELFKIKTFLVMLGAAALIQSSHAVVYSFSTIHWKSIGYSETLIGLLWAEGVVAEIILFHYSAAVLRHFSPVMLIIVGAAAGVLRWTIMGTTDALPALFIAQALHGLTFGAAHLGAIHYISDTIPPHLSATAQSLLSAVVMGIAIGITTIAAGAMYGVIGAQSYYPMASMAVASAILGVLLYIRVNRNA
mgnify:CR=1 FL=1